MIYRPLPHAPTTNETRRAVMCRAWSLYRSRRSSPSRRFFALCLRLAWNGERNRQRARVLSRLGLRPVRSRLQPQSIRRSRYALSPSGRPVRLR